MKKSKILIHNFYVYCGGGLVLSELCRSLRELGYDARLLVTHINPQNEAGLKYFRKTWLKDNLISLLHIIICKCMPFAEVKKRFDYASYFPLHLRGIKRQWLPYFDKDRDIIIHPETVYGNPFDAKNVVRWQLYHYQHFEDRCAYSDSDLFLGYREVFNDRQRTPDVENIEISCFNSNLYRRTNYGDRNGKCFIVRKGASRKDLPEKLDGIVVDELPETEIVKVFNQCEYCYSYDTQTFYSSIAAICGCKSIVVPEPGKSMSDYRDPSEASFGVAWGDSEEEIGRAANTVDKLIETIESYHNSNLVEALKLIEILKEKFNVEIVKVK